MAARGEEGVWGPE